MPLPLTSRLGRGGGSYDRALPRVRPGIPVVALLYSDEVRAELPREPWDVAGDGFPHARGVDPNWTQEYLISDDG